MCWRECTPTSQYFVQNCRKFLSYLEDTQMSGVTKEGHLFLPCPGWDKGSLTASAVKCYGPVVVSKKMWKWLKRSGESKTLLEYHELGIIKSGVHALPHGIIRRTRKYETQRVKLPLQRHMLGQSRMSDPIDGIAFATSQALKRKTKMLWKV